MSVPQVFRLSRSITANEPTVYAHHQDGSGYQYHQTWPLWSNHAASGNQDTVKPQHCAVDSSVTSRRITDKEERSREGMPEYPGLERWKLVEKIGSGAFSSVYRAKDSRNEMPEAAIKVIRKCELSISQKANTLGEVQIMRPLHHENIVGLIAFSESEEYYYIILELCPGGDLFDQIVRLTYFSEDLTRHTIVQVARAIEYLHENKRIIHGDIKPENILFFPIPFHPTAISPKGPSEEKANEGKFIIGLGSGGIGHIKLADFGLSSVVCDHQRTATGGTVSYAAPEIVKGEPFSKSIDMWALGCVLYALLCGCLPFYHTDAEVLKEIVGSGDYSFLSPWWDDISNSAQDVVSHLLRVNPAQRYTIAEFLNHPWILETKTPV